MDDLDKRSSYVPDLPIFDISKINLVELGRQLQDTLKQGTSNWIWLKKRQNEKVFLDEERMRALNAQIQDLQDMNSALLNLNAEVYLTQERLERIIQRYREHENFLDAEGRRLSEIKTAQHKQELQKLDDEDISRSKQIQSLDLENKRKEVEIEFLRSQIDNQKAQREKEDIRMTLMRKVIDKIDINELPDYLRTFVINSIFNPSQPITTEMQLMGELRDFATESYKRKMEAETRKAEAEATSKESQATIEKTTSDKTVLDFDEYKNKHRDGGFDGS